MTETSCVCRRRSLLLVAALALVAGVLVAHPVAGAEFDRSFTAAPGTRLDVRLFGGTVIVRGADRPGVRVHASHFATDTIAVRMADGVMAVRARARAGSPHAIDLAIDVPAWMPVSVAGTYVDISIEGTRATVSAETVRGDVRVKGGAGAITLKSVEGEVTLGGAEGRAVMTAVNNDLRVDGLDGELVASTVNGSVKLARVRSRSVDAGTVGGDISWTGKLDAGGRYAFATHGGDIDVTLDAAPNASVAVRAFDGWFRSAYPPPAPAESAARNRITFALGKGGARLELETFRGTISLRPGAE